MSAPKKRGATKRGSFPRKRAATTSAAVASQTRWFRRTRRVFLGTAGILIGLFLVVRSLNPPTSALILIRSVQVTLGVRESYGDKSWSWVPLTEISPHLQRSVVVAEDARFLLHHGIDFSSLASVLSGERRRSRAPRGASTITMQTVKNLFLWPGRSYLRKIIELGVSPIFDLIVGKRRILELYLNLVEWGPGIYGAEAAAQRYFKKGAKSLTLGESAALAAVLPSPLTISPRSLTSIARRRLARIMREAGGASLP